MKLGLTGNSLNSIIIFSSHMISVQFASFDGNVCQISWFVVYNGYILILMRGCYQFSVSFVLVSCRMGLSKLPNQHNVGGHAVDVMAYILMVILEMVGNISRRNCAIVVLNGIHLHETPELFGDNPFSPHLRLLLL